MQVYVVGGAVRDTYLNRPITDKDYVVVGTTPQHMLAEGFKQVGSDFPVFLHPSSRAEYALARTERKSGKGYKGFEVYASPEVTLEEDLKRRDLTINAMAVEVMGLYDDTPKSGEVIDPYGGMADIEQRLLRHVSEAFQEDPLRVLRIARFYGRFYDGTDNSFAIAPETKALISLINVSGELTHLTPERIWTETRRAMKQASPQAYFDCLMELGSLSSLMPSVAMALNDPFKRRFIFKALSLSAHANLSLASSWAILTMCFAPSVLLDRMGLTDCSRNNPINANTHSQYDELTTGWISDIKHLSHSLKVPNAITQFATLLATTYPLLVSLGALGAITPEDLAKLITLTKANKDSAMLDALMNTFYVISTAYKQCQLSEVIAAYDQIGMDDIPAGLTGANIGNALNAARIHGIEKALNKF